MLKAIRFDEIIHKHLLDFIAEYRNQKGKQNDSEAIRHLMQLGYDHLSATPTDQTIDLNKIKSDVLNDVMMFLWEKEPTEKIDINAIKKEIIKGINQGNEQSSLNINSLKQELLNEIKKELVSQQPQPILIQQPTSSDLNTIVLTKLLERIEAPAPQTQSLETAQLMYKILEKLESIDSRPQVQFPDFQPQGSSLEVARTRRAKVEERVEIPPDTDGLLANILGNANR